MTSEENKYDSWHTQHVEDNDILTPWHNFARSALRLQDLENKSILEIGCGRGGFSDFLVSSYPSIKVFYGCDFSESALQIAKKRLQPVAKIVWQKEDIQLLSFSDQTFDTIISCETIEHVPHPAKALEELHRVLKPGGRLILTCPNYFNFFGIWCLYRKIIGKPYTEGGQPYVNYLLIPGLYTKLKTLGFIVAHFHSSELVLPARVPRTFYPLKVPKWLSFFGSRTFYVIQKPL